MSMELTTLWKLTNQPAPSIEDGRVVGPVFVTIWLFVILLFIPLFGRLFKGARTTWSEFGVIRIGVLLFSVRNLFVVVDRWIHYANNSVSFGYILIYPIIEILDVSSGIIFIWSTFRVVWVELADRFNPSPRARWLLAAKIAIFIVSLLSIYYNILYLALAIVWMQFMSLNTIADIATKRTQFEIAKGGFFFLFGLLTVGACSTTLLVKAKKTDGKVPPSRVYTALPATVFLCIRSFVDFVLALVAYGPTLTRQDLALTRDVCHGLLTSLFLIFMLWMAWIVRRPHDSGGSQSRLIQGALRQYILDYLDAETHQGLDESPRFDKVIDDIASTLPLVLGDQALFGDPVLENVDKEKYASEYITDLKKGFGHLDPVVIAREEESRSASRISRPHSTLSLGRLRRTRPSTSTLGSSHGQQAPIPESIPLRPVSNPNPRATHARQPTRFASDPTIPRHPSLSSFLNNTGRRVSPGEQAVPPSNIPVIQENPEQEDLSAYTSVVPRRPVPTGVHFHPFGGVHSREASPLPSTWGGSPASSAATPYTGPGVTQDPGYWAGQRTWVNTPVSEEGGPSRRTPVPPIVPITERTGPSYRDRLRARRASGAVLNA